MFSKKYEESKCMLSTVLNENEWRKWLSDVKKTLLFYKSLVLRILYITTDPRN